MATKQKIAELRDFIRAEGRAENIPDILKNRRFSNLKDSEMLGISSDERIIDLQKLETGISEIQKQLDEKGVKVHFSRNDNGTPYSVQVYKSNGGRAFTHYSQIHENSMSVTLDTYGKQILELVDKCLVEDII